MSRTLLGTKLHIPPLGRALVPRQRLISQLESGLNVKLSLVLAPAGFGKTTLITSWIRSWQDTQSHTHPQVAWLSLDRNDDDPSQFGSYCILALQTIAPHLGEVAESMLGLPQPMTPEHMISSLINDLAGWHRPILLVLDDYHFIQSQEIHDAIAFALDYAPPQFHLLITSREEPPLPLARWRVRGQLVEIGFQDLRFTHEETAAFLDQVMGLKLTTEAISQLEERTEGWVAGLQMAALSLRKCPQNSAAIARAIGTFSGQHRYVVDYLAAEVMRQQPTHIRDFLQQTAILDRLTASLCDAVTGQTNSEAILAQLEHGNLFLISLDEQRQWYRYHHLFADFLRTALPIAQQQVLHRKASQWYEAHHFTAQAIHHALAAEDFETATRLIIRYNDDELKRGGLTTLLGWLNALPEEVVRSNIVLSVRKGHILYLRGRTEEAQPYAAIVEAMLHSDIPPLDRGEACVFLADLAINQGRAADCLRLAQEALSCISHPQAFSRTLALSLAGQAQCVLRDFNGAIQTLEQAVEWGRQSGNHLVSLNALSHLAQRLYFQGRRLEAVVICQQAVETYVDGHGQPLPISGLLHVPLGILYYEANELEQGRRHLEIGVALCQQLGMLHLSLTGQRILAKLQFAQGEIETAFATLSDAQQLAARLGNARAERAIIAVTADLHLRQGNTAAAANMLETSISLNNGPQVLRDRERLTRIRLRLAQNQPQMAESLLQELAQIVEKDGRVARLITIYILQAITTHTLKDQQTALKLMEKAIRLAAPGNYQRLFLDEGCTVGLLLQPLRHIAPDFVTRLLRTLISIGNSSEARPAVAIFEQGEMLSERLSEREREVLRLVAAGLSNEAIGSKLFISVGTVKWYLNGIYHKLDVRSRTEAVARARQHQLL
ncbi:MAG: LuxR C-terminal-related transcriptional regulator [Acidobacteriota bacterium]